MFQPNLGKPMRVLYVAFGVAMVALPWCVAMKGWWNVALPMVGVLSIAGGASGL